MIKHLALSVLALSLSSANAETSNFTVDDTHASIVFKVRHLGFAHVYGMFGSSSGKVVWDTDMAKSSMEITVKADSLTTNNKKRDDHLKGPDFFNVKQFPNIVLKSKSIKKLDGNKYEVNADLTVHGVTKPIKFTVAQGNTGKDPWGNIRTGGDATFTIKRTDFGMNYMSKPGEIGDEVEVMVSFEAIKK